MTEQEIQKLANSVLKYEKENPDGAKKEFEEVPDDNYEVIINSMKVGKSKKGDDMFTADFIIQAGNFKKQHIFMNQLLTADWMIASINDLLRSLGYEHDEIFFKNFDQFDEQARDICDEVKGVSFELNYSTNSKGFHNYKLTEIVD